MQKYLLGKSQIPAYRKLLLYLKYCIVYHVLRITGNFIKSASELLEIIGIESSVRNMNEELSSRMPEEWQKKREQKKKARRRRVLIYKGIMGAVILLTAIGIWLIATNHGGDDGSHIEETEMETTEENTSPTAIATPSSAEIVDLETGEAENVEEETLPTQTEETNPLAAYENPGIADVSDYLNIRENAENGAVIIGRLPADAVCEILEEGEVWYHIQSGGIEGYINGSYLLTGEEAIERAEQLLETDHELKEAEPVT